MAADHGSQTDRRPLYDFDYADVFHRRILCCFDATGTIDSAGGPGYRADIQQTFHNARRNNGLVLSDSVHPGRAWKFCIAVDDWRAGCCVSQTESAELVYIRCRLAIHFLCSRQRRCRHRLDILYAVQHGRIEYARDRHNVRNLYHRFFHDHLRNEFHSDSPQNARSWTDVVPIALVRLVALCNQRNYGPGYAGTGSNAVAARRRANLSRWNFRSGAWRRSAVVSAFLLV